MQDETFTYLEAKSNEWYTPPRYVEAARSVMGAIDLDSASCEAANKIVKATRFYTKEENGLILPWSLDGRPAKVWCNPPYGRALKYDTGNTSLFVQKLLQEYQSGHIEQAVLLTTTQHHARWFAPLWQFSLCFVDHKIHFLTTKPTKKNPMATHMFGTAFVYLGPNDEKFREVFARFGVTIPPLVQASERAQGDLWVLQNEDDGLAGERKEIDARSAKDV